MNIYVEGKDFYLVGSNFAMFPALEILHSTDLLHWERVSRVVDAASKALTGQTGPGQGTWGAFIVKPSSDLYRVYFAINATQWFASAKSLAGPWSDPTQVTAFQVSPEGGSPVDRGTGSDNSVFTDPDSKKTYMLTKNGLGQWMSDNATVKDWGMNRLVPIKADDGQLDESGMISLDFVNYTDAKGGAGPRHNDSSGADMTDWGHWAEGPTMAKRGDWYYYFVQTHTACFGQMDTWASKKLDGDSSNWHWLGYVMGPGDPYNGTQHATAPFQIADGTWWVFAHSYDCTDNLETPAHHGEWMGLAREGLLLQVTWVDTKLDDGTTVPVPHFTSGTRNLPAPALAQSKTPFLLPVNDDFSAKTLGTAWTTFDQMGAKLSVTAREGWLRIAPDTDYPTVWALQKEALRSTASVAKLEFEPAADGDAAGICVRNGFWDDQQLLSGPTWIESKGFIVGSHDVQVARAKVNGADVIQFAYRARTPVAIASYPADQKPSAYQSLADAVVVSYSTAAPKQSAVWLKLVRSGHQATGWFSTDRATWTQVGQAINIKELDDNYGMSNAWVGNQAGIFATNKSADFDLFTYRDGFTAIPAVATDQQSGTTLMTSATKGSVLGNLHDGSWALYGSVDLGSGGVSTASAKLDAASVGGASVEIWLDSMSSDQHVGPCALTNSLGWETFAVSTCKLTASGTHDVYLKVVGQPGSELVRIASLQFAP
jgi:beta-xylosidase